MQSLAAQHRAKVEAGATVAPATTTGKPAQHKHRLVWASLETDMKRLSQVRSKQRKAEIKRELLPRYADHLTAIINGADYRHDESLVTLCVWALDADDWHTALMLAAFALKHGMDSPQRFKRSLAETLLEEAAIQAKRQGFPSHLRDHLQHLQELTQGADIADEVTAKFYKAFGLSLEHTDKAAALVAFNTAQQYGAQVKRNIKRLEKGVNHAA